MQYKPIIIEKIAISKINPAAYNPRKDLKPEDPEYQKLKKSIEEFDIVEPLIWNKRSGNLVGGHQRLKVLIEQGIQEVDVSVVDLPDSKEKALNIALNKISGDWDLPKLKDLLQELDTGEFDIEITGFDEGEIEDLINKLYVPDENEKDDDIPEVPEEPVSKKGDLYKLGEHRLLCGDATIIDDVEKLMDGKVAAMLFTDPPYNVSYKDLNTKMRTRDWNYCAAWNDKMSNVDYAKFLVKFIGNAKAVLNAYGHYYIWFAFTFYRALLAAFESNDVKYDMVPIIWRKQAVPISWSRYHRNYEPCLFGGKNIYTHKNGGIWYGPNNETCIWDINIDYNKSYVHPTQKPVALAERAIRNSSKLEDIVLDLFGGSGSTMIAAEKMNRCCYSTEIEPHYCDVIVKRWEYYTGKKAELVLNEIHT